METAEPCEEDPYARLEEDRFAVHMQTARANDPYDYEEDKFAVHVANQAAKRAADDAPSNDAANDGGDEEDIRFRLHQLTERLSGQQMADACIDPYDEDARYAVHLQSAVAADEPAAPVLVSPSDPEPAAPQRAAVADGRS